MQVVQGGDNDDERRHHLVVRVCESFVTSFVTMNTVALRARLHDFHLQRGNRSTQDGENADRRRGVRGSA
jgi:hypothetical protein